MKVVKAEKETLVKNNRVLTAVALVFCLAFIVVGCGKKESEPSKKSSGLAVSEKLRILRDLQEKSSSENLMEPLLTEKGIRRKVVIAKKGIRSRRGQNPSSSVADGPALKYFRPYFVFDEKEFGDQVYYLISPTPRQVNIIGWVSAAEAHPWNTRVGDRYGREDKSVKPILYVYESDGMLKANLRGERTFAGQKVQAFAQTSYKYEYKTLMPWPIIEKQIYTHGDKTYELHRILFLGYVKEGADLREDASSTPPVTTVKEEERQKIITRVKAGVSKLDVVFVVDTTGSMDPFFSPVQQAIKNFVGQLSNLPFKPKLSFGLVEYRDYEGGFGEAKPLRIHPLTQDVNRFVKTIEELNSDGGGDDLEAVFDAVKAGLTQTKWTDNLSERIVILIGDFAGHEPGSDQNPHGIKLTDVTTIANRQDVHATIFSLRVGDRGSEQQRKLHFTQFSQLASGTGGKCFSFEEAQKVVPSVESILGLGTNVAGERFEIVEAASQGEIDFTKKAAKPTATLNIDDRKVSEVLEFLAAAGYKYSDLAPGQTAFSSGWVATEASGVQVLDKEVYLAKTELNMLLANLHMLVSVLDRPEMMVNLAKGAGLARAEGFFPTLDSFFTSETLETMDVWMMVEGIPVGSHSILTFSKNDLENMSPSQRQEVARQVQQICIPHLTNDSNDNDRFPEPDKISFGWVREKYLP